MFPSSSPTFSKLKCPSLSEKSVCPYGPDLCVFSHNPIVYNKGGLDGRIGLSSMTYFKDLQQRMRAEEAACKESQLFDSSTSVQEPVPLSDKFSKALEKNGLSDFLHRAPTGCKVSQDLREKVLLKLIKSMRQVDATTTLHQAAEVEGELLMRSGGGKVASIYLSQVTGIVKKYSEGVGADENITSISSLKSGISYEELKEISASKKTLSDYLFPKECGEGELASSLVECSSTQQRCRRCGVTFIPSKYYENDDQNGSVCRFHEGKFEKSGGLRVYSCCQAPQGFSDGCETRPWHVFEGYRKGDPIPKFHKLKENNSNEKEKDGQKVLALDAEMFYTAGGYEVSRLTVIDFFSEVTVLDVLIEPRCRPVLDYNTKYSGISAELYTSGQYPVLSFDQMKLALGEIIGHETILIGHSLDNDLRVLEVYHDLIVDTSILFPHPSGAPMRFSLKTLALGHLSELVQQGVDGHDSREDCMTCVQLIKKQFNKLKRIDKNAL